MKFLAILGILGIAALLSAQTTIPVEGVGVDAKTGAGVDGVAVLMLGSPNDKVITNGGGTFRATVTRPGDYMTILEKEGYLNSGFLMFHVGSDDNPARPRLRLV